MRVTDDLAAWRAAAVEARAAGQVVGLVPTMGALHAGHDSLIAHARAECGFVIVSIFVNPRQFSETSDLAHYPRTPAADLALCERAGVDLVVEPAVSAMWPSWPVPTLTTVHVAGIGDRWEGAGRPGHFDGVASVVTKLLSLTGPCRAYFGEKDYQQLFLVAQMVHDLDLPATIVACPIVRDDDGLALSSRNARLSPRGRARAVGLSRAVAAVATVTDAADARATMARVLADHQIDVAYADVVDTVTLAPVDPAWRGPAHALVAGFVDGVRLIDNGAVIVGTS